jgi:hypothetical protein
MITEELYKKLSRLKEISFLYDKSSFGDFYKDKIQIAARITFQSDPFKSHEEKNFLIINDCKTVEQVAERVKQILIMELDR